jgi:SAM-dependent methyltransferase
MIDYEGAEIVQDLNEELQPKYHHIADFIFNGSCLDNLFDPATAMKSISKMLRPRGRVVHIEHGSPIQSAFVCYSPEWFFNYYAINNYTDCQIFVCSFGVSLQNSWVVNRWVPFEQQGDQFTPMPLNMGVGDFVNIVVAEKGDDSTDTKIPIQSCYRVFQHDKTHDIYVQKHLEFLKSSRAYRFRKEPDPNPGFPETASGDRLLISYPFEELLAALLAKLKAAIRRKLKLSQAPVVDETGAVIAPAATKLPTFTGVLMR